MFLTGLTVEEYELIEKVFNEHEEQFKEWAEENEDTLMKWSNETPYVDMFSRASKFALYCCKEFMKYKNGERD